MCWPGSSAQTLNNRTNHIGIDGSYAHIFLDNSNINVTRSFFDTVPAIQTFATIKAQTSVSIDILTVGLTYKF